MYRAAVILITAIVVTIASGCATQQQFLQSKRNMAFNTAMNRAQFEMNCQDVKPVLISQEVVQPALQGPWVNGIERAEYTIGAEGCGKRMTFIVVCPQGGEGCFAAGPGRFHGWQEQGQ
jgi:hypothetical protein